MTADFSHPHFLFVWPSYALALATFVFLFARTAGQAARAARRAKEEEKRAAGKDQP